MRESKKSEGGLLKPTPPPDLIGLRMIAQLRVCTVYTSTASIIYENSGDFIACNKIMCISYNINTKVLIIAFVK